MSDYDTRGGELLAWSAETGLPLPASVAEILDLEDAGFVVDLVTGDVLSNVTASPTVLGETWAVLDSMEMPAHD